MNNGTYKVTLEFDVNSPIKEKELYNFFNVIMNKTKYLDLVNMSKPIEINEETELLESIIKEALISHQMELLAEDIFENKGKG